MEVATEVSLEESTNSQFCGDFLTFEDAGATPNSVPICGKVLKKFFITCISGNL